MKFFSTSCLARRLGLISGSTSVTPEQKKSGNRVELEDGKYGKGG